jgi:catechol 2,3-dioxygenase-like lactoylglutathione lyase family enzyme
MPIRINITSIFVDDQAKALSFYTEKLGFLPKHDVPLGAHRWLTVVGAGDPDGVELLLEPDEHPAAKAYMRALVEDGIPATSFAVDDVAATVQELEGKGVTVTQPATPMGPVVVATIDDTCGNLIQLTSPA